MAEGSAAAQPSGAGTVDPGALPDPAVERLGGAASTPFTSDLSVREFLLVEGCGFEPRGLVLGSSIFHIGLTGKSRLRSREVRRLSQAMYTARELAMARMEEEASLLSAAGVVGVRLRINLHDWSRRAAEFIAVGTAIAGPAAPDGPPYTSALSGQEFWLLHQHGYQPLGLVMGTCVYHVGRRGPHQVVAQAMRNREMSVATQGLYEARELAMLRMQAEATALGADGIVGVRLEESSHFWGRHVIEFLAIGTAVRRGHDAAPDLAPLAVVPLAR